MRGCPWREKLKRMSACLSNPLGARRAPQEAKGGTHRVVQGQGGHVLRGTMEESRVFPSSCLRIFHKRERVNFMNFLQGDIPGSRRRALRELHTLPHRDGYRREDELDSEVIFRAERRESEHSPRLARVINVNRNFSVIPTQCTYSGVVNSAASGSPAIRDDVARRFVESFPPPDENPQP